MANSTVDIEKLLKDKRVVAEIERHLWLESEKLGYDIGYDQAKEEWLKNFSTAWMQYHMPEELIKARKARVKKVVDKVTLAKKTAPKRRRAKSYI